MNSSPNPRVVVAHRIWVFSVSLVAACAALLALGPVARAQSVWNSFNTTGLVPGNWSTAGNWTGTTPTFTDTTQLTFGSSPAANYSTTISSVNYVIPGSTYATLNDSNNGNSGYANNMTFNLEGLNFGSPVQPYVTSAGAPGFPVAPQGAALVINSGDIPSQRIALMTSPTNVAPSLTMNGNGSVLIQNGAGGGMYISYVVGEMGSTATAQPLQVNGSGLGTIRIDANIIQDPVNGTTSGINVNFGASAVKPFGTGATLLLTAGNSFVGNVTLNSGILALGTSTALGASTNNLIINGTNNSLHFAGSATYAAPLVIANPVTINGTMSINGAETTGAQFTGVISGNGGITVGTPGVSSGAFLQPNIAIQAAAQFTGPLVIKPVGTNAAGTGITNSVSISGGGALTTTNIQLYPSGGLILDNTSNALSPRLAANTTVSSYRGYVGLVANSAVGATETITTLNASGMTSLYAVPTAGAGSQLTVTTLNRVQNGTFEFRGNQLGGTAGNNVANIFITNNPGGQTPGSTTPGTQNLAVLPYAYGNSVSSTTSSFVLPPAVSLVRWDATSSQVVPLNTSTEYANAQTMSAANTSGLNFYLSGGANGGIVVNNSSTINGLVLANDTTATAISPNIFASIGGTGTLNVTGPVVMTLLGNNPPLSNSLSLMASQISVNTLAFGSNTAYFTNVVNSGAYTVITSALTGTGGMVKSGASDLILYGNNGITGGLTINAGNIVFDADSQLGAAGQTVTMNSGGDGLAYVPNFRFASSNATGLTLSRPIVLGPGGGGLSASAGVGALNYTGAISGSGVLMIGKGGGGIVNLNPSSNTSTGDVVVTAGYLVPASDAALGSGSNVLFGTNTFFQPGVGYSSTNRNFMDVAGGIAFSGSPQVGFFLITANGDFTINGTLGMPSASSNNFNQLAAGFTKIGAHNLTLTSPSTLIGQITLGEASASNSLGARYSTPNAIQFGGSLTLSGNGSTPLAYCYNLNDGNTIVMDNTTTVVQDRMSVGPVYMNQRSGLTLIGNAGANVTESIGPISVGGGSLNGGTMTITVNQPNSGGAGKVTTLTSPFLGVYQSQEPQVFAANGAGTLFVRGTNLGATSGDYGQFLVNLTSFANPNGTTGILAPNGLVYATVTASSATSSPTDFAKTAAVGSMTAIVPLVPADYGNISGGVVTPGTYNAIDVPSAAQLSSGATISALRISGGSLDLNGQTLTMGNTTGATTAQVGIVMTTTAATSITDSTLSGAAAIEFGSQSARFVINNDLTIGSAAANGGVALLQTSPNANASPLLVKSGAGTLTLYGNANTTIGTSLNGTTRSAGFVTISEGKLVLGNANALGKTAGTSTTTVFGAMPTFAINAGATLDVNSQSLLFQGLTGGGTLALGTGSVTLGNNGSLSFSGNITGTNPSASVNFGVSQGTTPGNSFFTGSAYVLAGDNTGYAGQYSILSSVVQIKSQNAIAAGATINLGDTLYVSGSSSKTSTITFFDQMANINANIKVSNFTTFGALTNSVAILGSEASGGFQTMTGTIQLNNSTGSRVQALGANNGAGRGELIVNSLISGTGPLYVDPFVVGAGSSGGNIGIMNGANSYTGGTILNEGNGSSTNVNVFTAVGADTVFGPVNLNDAITLQANPGNLRAENGSRNLAYPIFVNPPTSATTRPVQFGFVGTNDITLSGAMSSSLANPGSAQVVNLIVNDYSTGNATLSGTISNDAATPNITLGFTKNGPGTLIFSGANNTFSGPVVLNAGTIGIGSTNALGTAVVTINGGTMTSVGGNFSIGNALTGPGNLMIEGPNTLTLGGASTATGNTQVNSGTLKIGTSTSLGFGGVVTALNTPVGTTTVVSGGSLDLNGQATINKPIILNGSGVGGVGALTNSSAAVAHIGSGVAGMTPTAFSTGNVAAPLNITFNGGGGSGGAGAGSLALSQAGIQITNNGVAYTATPTVVISAPNLLGGVQATATATRNSTTNTITAITLSNVGSGYTTVPTILITGGGSPTTPATAVFNNGFFSLVGINMTAAGSGYTSTPTVNFSSGAATATATLSSVTLASNSSIGGAGDIIVDAQVLGTGGLTKVGADTVTLTAANSYGGGTILNAGVLSVSADANLGAAAGGLTFNGGTFQVTGTTFNSTPRTITWGAAGGAFDINNAANTFTVSQNLTTGGPLAKLGAGTLVLSGTNTYTGGTTLTAGELSVSADTNLGNAAGGLTFNGGILQVTGTTYTTTTRPITWGAGGGGFDISNAANTFTVSVNLTGGGPLTKLGAGTLILNGVNTYTGGVTINNGVLAVSSDAALGDPAAPITVGPFGTLLYTGTTSTARSFPLNLGTLAVAAGQTLTLSDSKISGGYLAGPGTFATNATTGASFAGMTSRPSAIINSNSSLDQFLNFTNGGALNVAAGLPSPVTMTGVTNQGSGSINIGVGSQVNVSDFQSYGQLSIAPAVSPAFTQLNNKGASPMYFNGGSQTFIGTPATAGTYVAGIDLHGQNAIVAGGLFVNNGYVVDSTNSGAVVVADYGALVKGAGFFQYSPVTQNGGRVQAGNSPGSASFGSLTFGPGGVSNYVFAIDDATGAAGPKPDAAGHVSGWGLMKSVQQLVGASTTSGDFSWTADPSNKLHFAIDTLVNPTTVGVDVVGPLADFDPTRSYSWPAIQWTGTYSGPTDVAALDASTGFDTTGFLNPVNGTFGWSLDTAGQSLSLTYSPSAVPEPGTLALTAVGMGLGWLVRRRTRRGQVQSKA